MRLFVGLSLSEEARISLERTTLRLRDPSDGLRWSSPEQWHITLVFLGAVDPENLSGLVSGLKRIRSAAVPVRMDGLGTFERAGILYAGVEVAPELLRLHDRVTECVRASGLAVEARPYRPHITLARSRNRDGSRSLRRMQTLLEQQRLRVAWSAEEFLLYESVLSSSGSRYHVLERFALDGTL